MIDRNGDELASLPPARERVALVTGASGGIGRAIGKELATQGYRIAVHFRTSEDAAASVSSEIRRNGGDAAIFRADLDMADGAASLIEAVVGHFGAIDCLVNNAGILIPTPLGSVDRATMLRVFTSNLFAPVELVEAALPHFPDRSGRIINITSTLAANSRPPLSTYCAAKAALESFTRSLSRDLGPRGITVNAIAPGPTMTPMMAGVDEARKESMTAASPLGRLGQPEDIAQIAAFLASDAASWITGRVLIADGGAT